MTDTKEKFIAQANQFENILKVVAKAGQPVAEDTDVANTLFEQPDSAAKSDMTGNIDNLEKVLDVVQFQTEAMCEYVRSSVGPIITRLEANEEEENELIPMFLFMQDRLIKLHNQLDFFFSSFEEEDLKKGFSIARRTAQDFKFNESKQKEQVTDFVKQLRSRTLGYLQDVGELHDWLHGLLDLIESELTAQGVQGFAAVED